MVESKSKTIDGVNFTVTQFPARRAFAVQARLIKTLGPALGAAVGKGVGGEVDLSAALQKLADNIEADTLVALAQELLASTRADGKELAGDAAFDMAFTGKLLTLYKVLAFLVEVNFADFFGAGGIGGLVARFAPEAKTPSASSPQS
jgi:hypothetical protein